jgi:hypothetical protein
MSTTTTFQSAPATNRSNTNATLTRTLSATGIGLGVNTVVWAFGRIGEPIHVVIGRNAVPEPLAWSHVAVTTIAAIVLGGVVRAVMQRGSRKGKHERLWATTAMIIAVVSAMPLWRLDIDTASKILLTVMHLLTGVCCVATHFGERRHLQRRASEPATS